MPKKYIPLRSKIMELYGTYSRFANALGVTRQEVSSLLCGSRPFTRNTILKWIDALGIDRSEIGNYFF